MNYRLLMCLGLVVIGCGGSQQDKPPVVIDPKHLQKYQIGPSWDRFEVNQEYLKQQNNKALDVLARASAKFEAMDGTGTVFYLGQHNGKHLVATNRHVVQEHFAIAGVSLCSPEFNQMSFLGKVFFNPIFMSTPAEIQCVAVVGMWESIDFAILEIKDFSSSHYLESLVPMRLSRKMDIPRGTEFLSVGYGNHKNQNNQFQKAILGGKNCRLFSESPRLKNDEADNITAWSISTNCDVSPGDSGSALADTNSLGIVYGIFWSTDAIGKDKLLKDEYLEGLLNYPDDSLVWEELSYAVPSVKILEVLTEWLKNQSVSDESTRTVDAFLKDSI